MPSLKKVLKNFFFQTKEALLRLITPCHLCTGTNNSDSCRMNKAKETERNRVSWVGFLTPAVSDWNLHPTASQWVPKYGSELLLQPITFLSMILLGCKKWSGTLNMYTWICMYTVTNGENKTSTHTKDYNNDPNLRNLLSSDRIINKMMLAALWKKKKKKT